MIRWSFIEELEGKNVLHGYVPLDKFGLPIGESGVTIATGVDLGQLDRLGLVDLLKDYENKFELLHKLLPYVGLRKIRALQAIERKPVEITQDEAEALSEAMRNRTLEKLKKEWAETGLHTQFDLLPWQVQTVLYSLAYNFGTNLSDALPNTWKAFKISAASHDWTDAVVYMTNFPSKNKELEARRRKEAELLAELL